MNENWWIQCVLIMKETGMETVSRKKWSQPVGTKSGWKAGFGRVYLARWGSTLVWYVFTETYIWLKQPVGTQKGWQPPSEVASHLPVSMILRYRLFMCLLHGSYLIKCELFKVRKILLEYNLDRLQGRINIKKPLVISIIMFHKSITYVLNYLNHKDYKNSNPVSTFCKIYSINPFQNVSASLTDELKQ